MEASMEALLFSCAPIAAGAGILCGASYWWSRGRELREKGVTARARVVTKSRFRFGTVFVVSFTDAGGTPRTVKISMRSTRGGMIGEGNTVPITYVPAHPEKAQMGRKWGAHIEGWLALLVAAFGGGMIVYGLYLAFGFLTGRIEP